MSSIQIYLIRYLFYRVNVPPAVSFIGTRIMKEYPDGTERQGQVVKLLNQELVNSMFRVQWDDGEMEQFRNKTYT